MIYIIFQRKRPSFDLSSKWLWKVVISYQLSKSNPNFAERSRHVNCWTKWPGTFRLPQQSILNSFKYNLCVTGKSLFDKYHHFLTSLKSTYNLSFYKSSRLPWLDRYNLDCGSYGWMLDMSAMKISTLSKCKTKKIYYWHSEFETGRWKQNKNH